MARFILRIRTLVVVIDGYICLLWIKRRFTASSTSDYTAIPNSNGSRGYRIDLAPVSQNGVKELTVGCCRNGSQRTEFYGGDELFPICLFPLSPRRGFMHIPRKGIFQGLSIEELGVKRP